MADWHIYILEDPPALERRRWFVHGTDGFDSIDDAVAWGESHSPNLVIRTFGPLFWFIGARPDWNDDTADGPMQPWPPNAEQREMIDATYRRVQAGEIEPHRSTAPTYETLEETACGDIPRRFVKIAGSVIDGDRATVWSLTNEAPDFEPYEVQCHRDADGRWSWGSGSGGFSTNTPVWVLENARALGWSEPSPEELARFVQDRLAQLRNSE